MIKYKYQTKGGTPMNQMTLTDMEYSNRKKKTKREEFFDAMDEISGWQDSNLRPPGPKPGALAKLSHTPTDIKLSLFL